MNGRKIQETHSRHNFLVLLMVLSLSFLIMLQAAWLRSEYRSAANSFRRETNMVFRSTIMQIADSLFIAGFMNNPELDSLLATRNVQLDRLYEFRDSLSVSDIEQKRSHAGFRNEVKIYSKSQFHDSDTHRVTIIRSPRNQNNPRNIREEARQAPHFRFFSNFKVRSIDPDTIGMLYREALHYRFRNLPIQIIRKQVNWMEFDWSRRPRQISDTLRFATGFYPIGPQYVYAASFENVSGLLFMEVLPQFGFSFVTTGLIIGLFMLTLRYMRAQQKLIQQKNDFIGNMTHELKTPVATVGVALEAMKNFDVLKNPLKSEEYIDMALHELERLSLMTDKILKTSVYDYKTEIQNSKTPVNISYLAEKVFDSFRLVAEKNHISFDLNSTDGAWISGHSEHLLQMIYNLVDNAFKYSGSQSRIILTVKRSNDVVELEISDNGPGIAPEHHRKIFEKFYRVPSGNIHTVKGYGLGLSYVDGVVKSHGGKITLVSQPGSGSVFTVFLPAIVDNGKN